MYHLMPRPLLTEARCFPFNSIPPPTEVSLLSLRQVLDSLIVRLYYSTRSFDLITFIGMVDSIIDNEPADWDYG